MSLNKKISRRESSNGSAGYGSVGSSRSDGNDGPGCCPKSDG